jgi:hypothetical protein
MHLPNWRWQDAPLSSNAKPQFCAHLLAGQLEISLLRPVELFG